jgi:teichuronic acid biosynthesis glycosyltransferase TuaC
MSRLKILMLTRLFPSKAFPTLGTFCLERAKALAMHAEVRVMVPTPWFPSWIPGPDEWRKWTQVEREGVIEGGIRVTYPRYLSIPKLATWHQGTAMAHSVLSELKARYGDWRPDVVDGHFAFPDGYAAVKLAQAIGCPGIVTCHGSDLRLYPDLPVAGRMLRWTLRNANRIVNVSTALQQRSIELGCLKERTVFLANGVDPAKFVLRSKEECRQQLDLPVDRRIGVCVAALIDVKNQSLIIWAMDEIRRQGEVLPLIILVGEGQNRTLLLNEIEDLGLSDYFIFAGQRPHSEVALWMGAADWLLLSSKSEGWATVYFEAMSCGRPVLTTNVSSARDAIGRSQYGLVIEPSTPTAFASALIEASKRKFDETVIRAYAEEHSWASWAEEMMVVMNNTVRPVHA